MRLLVGTALMLALVMLAPAQGRGRGNGPGGPPRGVEAAREGVIFNDDARRILRDWRRQQPNNSLPPGLARRGSLPPGLQKQLVRNGRLPPGLERRISPFPDDLNRRLGPLPPGCGCERRFFDGRAMIVATATNTILDVMNLY